MPSPSDTPHSAPRTPHSYDVIILGAGIVGAACAYECARAGLRVAVVERDVVGGGATAQGMGHIVVMDDSEAQFALTRYSQQLWNELDETIPRDVPRWQIEYEHCGTLWVATDDEEMEEVARKQTFYQQRGIACETLDEKQLAAAEPNLRPGLAGGLRVPADGVSYPTRAVAFMLEKATNEHGAQLIQQTAVQLNPDGVTLADGTKLKAGNVVNALGAWSPEFTPGIDVQRRKGHLVITDRYPGYVRHQLIELGYLKSAHSHNAASVAFNAQPRQTGQILLGSSRQFGVESPIVDPPMLQWMIQRAIEYMPGFAQLRAVRVWTGFRAATSDHLPLIGPHPAISNLYLATGHEGLGITTSLGTARLVADQLLGRPPAIPAAPYLPARAQGGNAHA